MIRASRIALRASLAALALGVAPARAADLEVSPVVLELSDARRTTLLTLRNAGPAPARLQVKAFAWTQAGDGAMRLAPTRELVVFPPLLELAPGEVRNVRVGTDAPAALLERSWRLAVEEMPPASVPAGGARVRVLTRVGIPVFLAPARERVEKGELAFLGRSGDRLRFALRNTGTVRLRPPAVTLAVLSRTGERVYEAPLEAWYVLASEERLYEVELPAAACAAGAEAVVTAKLETGALEARAAVACRGP